MSSPVVRLTLDEPSGHYQPGQRLTGRFMVDGTQPWAVRAAELSVLWYTAGQGEEDFSVHYFERLVDEPGRPLDLRVPRRFTTVLPQSPLSYDGRIVKVCWCLRLRLTLMQGNESLTEVPFRLGSVPPAGEVADSVTEQVTTTTTAHR
jgi:hypothetical protein